MCATLERAIDILADCQIRPLSSGPLELPIDRKLLGKNGYFILQPVAGIGLAIIDGQFPWCFAIIKPNHKIPQQLGTVTHFGYTENMLLLGTRRRIIIGTILDCVFMNMLGNRLPKWIS